MGCCQTSCEKLPYKQPEFNARIIYDYYFNVHEIYEIKSLLGEGASGRVYCVKDKRTGLTKAMKELKRANISESEKKSMTREVKILKHLDHPNIVKVYELIQNTYNLFIVTEFLEGGELFDHIIQETYFTEANASNYFKQLISALSYLHSKGVVHRDLKPENLVFAEKSPESPLKIIDFGISKILNPGKVLKEAVGTINYMAPETFTSRSYNEKCDIWSAGVILYVMLTGRSPFYHVEKKNMIELIQEGKLSLENPVFKGVSVEAKSLLKSMLNPNPKRRPSATKILKHAWLKKHEEPIDLSEVLSVSLHNLKGFQTECKLVKAIRLFISSQIISSQEEKELIKVFESLDTNHDGRLSKSELIKGYEILGLNKEINIEEVFLKADFNQSGYIEYTEFLNAAEIQIREIQEKRLLKVFNFYNEGGEDLLCPSKLKSGIKGIEHSEWAQIIDEADTNQDGKLSFNEFKDYILSKF